LKVTLQDARALKYCSRGLRKFSKDHNLDWEVFRSEGISVEELSRCNDAMADALIEEARRRYDR
jgi:hypothetical protein